MSTATPMVNLTLRWRAYTGLQSLLKLMQDFFFGAGWRYGAIHESTNRYGEQQHVQYFFFYEARCSDAKKLEAKFPAFVDKYMGTGLKAAGFNKNNF